MLLISHKKKKKNGGGVAQFVKPGLHEPQLPVERSVTLVSSIAVERRC